MKKNPTVRLSCTAPKQFDFYLRWLLTSGLYGRTKSEVIATLLADGIKQAMPPHVAREIADQFHKAQREGAE